VKTKAFFLFVSLLISISLAGAQQIETASVSSPGGAISVKVFTDPSGHLKYQVQRGNTPILLDSPLSFRFKEIPEFGVDCAIVKTQRREVDETWDPLWGENEKIRNRFRELTVFIQSKESGAPSGQVTFRAYDDGVAFRTKIPKQKGSIVLN
jgi:alpha-glucosidase